MQWSKYNFIYNSKQHGWLLFNKLSTFFLDINDDALRNSLLCIKENPEQYFKNNNEIDLQLMLKKTAVLVADDATNVNYLNMLSTIILISKIMN